MGFKLQFSVEKWEVHSWGTQAVQYTKKRNTSHRTHKKLTIGLHHNLRPKDAKIGAAIRDFSR